MKYKRLSNIGYRDDEVDAYFGSEFLLEFDLLLDEMTQGRTPEQFASDLAKYSKGETARDVYNSTIRSEDGYDYITCQRYARKDISKMEPDTRREAAIKYEQIRKKNKRWLKRFRQALEKELS